MHETKKDHVLKTRQKYSPCCKLSSRGDGNSGTDSMVNEWSVNGRPSISTLSNNINYTVISTLSNNINYTVISTLSNNIHYTNYNTLHTFHTAIGHGKRELGTEKHLMRLTTGFIIVAANHNCSKYLGSNDSWWLSQWTFLIPWK